jgi:hypothetical protein
LSGSYDILSYDDAIKTDSDITIGSEDELNLNIETEEGDGIKCEGSLKSEDDASQVSLVSGNINIKSKYDGIQVENYASLNISGGRLSIEAGGGYVDSTAKNGYNGDDSFKGIKSEDSLTISGGTIDISSLDDGIHVKTLNDEEVEDDGVTYTITTTGKMNVTGGAITVFSSDDGLHSDDSVLISGGEPSIGGSQEGIEGALISIEGGENVVYAYDDGINAANSDYTNYDFKIEISGGKTYVNASGDGVDSNGSFTMSDGLLLVAGPTSQNNGELDADGNFVVDGGTLIAYGSGGQMDHFTVTGKQMTVYIAGLSISSGSYFALFDSNDELVVAFKAAKEAVSSFVSTPSLRDGEYTYAYLSDVKDTTVLYNSLYSSLDYDDSARDDIGTFSFSSSSKHVKIGNSSSGGGGRPGGR